MNEEHFEMLELHSQLHDVLIGKDIAIAIKAALLLHDDWISAVKKTQALDTRQTLSAILHGMADELVNDTPETTQ